MITILILISTPAGAAVWSILRPDAKADAVSYLQDGLRDMRRTAWSFEARGLVSVPHDGRVRSRLAIAETGFDERLRPSKEKDMRLSTFGALALAVALSGCKNSTATSDPASAESGSHAGDETHHHHHGDDGHSTEHEHHHGEDGHASEHAHHHGEDGHASEHDHHHGDDGHASEHEHHHGDEGAAHAHDEEHGEDDDDHHHHAESSDDP